MKLALTWDLDRFYPGGSQSQQLQGCFEKIETGLQQLKKNLQEQSHLPSVLELFQTLSMHLRQVRSFANCLIAQNDKDTAALCLQNRASHFTALFKTLSVVLDEWLLDLDDASFQSLITELSAISFPLQERRQLARDKLPAKEEGLIHHFAIDGYHGWCDLWNALIRDLSFPYRGEVLSFNQIDTLLDLPDPTERKEAFDSIEKTLIPFENSFAQALNHLAGFRLGIYAKRNWESPLKEALELNRLQEKTLTTMWETIEANQQGLVDYLNCKADLLGQEKLHWHDLSAPISKLTKKISYREASVFIVKHFSQFSPKLAAFAEQALQDNWVDAENRPGKGPGGFCTAFPLEKESRIFMTYSDTTSSLFVLAHELGHAFHNSVLFSLPEMAQHCRMNLAETASTMSEIIVTQAAIATETSDREKLALLDNHLSRAASYLLNIRARFLFECDFYRERKKGFVPAEKLSELMQNAQEVSYQKSLSRYHPLFWAAKMHFFLTDAPFYNFPYTFGYLFSLGIHALSSQLPRFEERYIALLKDTGQMTTESLAKKHLDVDLKEPSFWQLALDNIKKDSTTFQRLASTLSSSKSVSMH
ncbi:MAG: M3 family oligoendopeptidase [Chlamydiota bacterium]